MNDRPLDDVISEWSGKSNYGDLKKQVASSVKKMLSDFQSKLAEISDEEVYALMEKGELYANKKANAKLYDLQKAFELR